MSDRRHPRAGLQPAQEAGERAPVYSAPLPAPIESDYRTLDNIRVRLAPSIDPRQQATQVSLRALQERIPAPLTGVVLVALTALVLGGGLTWLVLDKYARPHDDSGTVVLGSSATSATASVAVTSERVVEGDVRARPSSEVASAGSTAPPVVASASRLPRTDRSQEVRPSPRVKAKRKAEEKTWVAPPKRKAWIE